MVKTEKCVIIGGGAAGLMCAARLLKGGVVPLVLEAGARVGRKILASGNGRCNLSNSGVGAERYNAPGFVAPVLEKYPLNEVLGWWKELGLTTRSDGEGRIYPYSNYAGSVLNILLEATSGAKILTSRPVLRVKKEGALFYVEYETGAVYAENVVFACGSAAGGGRASYNLLKGLGHKVTRLTPAITYLKTDKFKGLKGVRAKVYAKLETPSGVVGDRGEILFREDGVSGILAFWLSTFLARNNCGGVLNIDFAPDFTAEEIVREYGGRESLLCGLVHKALADKLLREGGLDRVKSCKAEVHLADKDNQVVCGGALLDMWDKDMQSKLHKNLYCIGEMADIDGECGGYNLHWAWVSALAAADAVLGDKR